MRILKCLLVALFCIAMIPSESEASAAGRAMRRARRHHRQVQANAAGLNYHVAMANSNYRTAAVNASVGRRVVFLRSGSGCPNGGCGRR